MLQKEFLIINKLGLHARASALLVKTASRFSSEVKLAREEVEVNGKSIMGIMMLAAGAGSRVTIIANGDDADAAASELERLLQADDIDEFSI